MKDMLAPFSANSEIERLRAEVKNFQREKYPRLNRYVVSTATYAVQLYDELLAVDYAGAVTITLPTFSGVTRLDSLSFRIAVKDESGAAGSNNITIDGNGANIIAPAASADVFDPVYSSHSSVVINSAYGCYVLYFNGTEWHYLM